MSGVELGHPKVVGNGLADHHVRAPVLGKGVPTVPWNTNPDEDAMRLLHSPSAVVGEIAVNSRPIAGRGGLATGQKCNSSPMTGIAGLEMGQRTTAAR